MLSLYFCRLFLVRLIVTFGTMFVAMIIISSYEVFAKMPSLKFTTMMLATFLMMPGIIGYVLPISVYLALVSLISYLYQSRSLLGFMTLGMSTKRLVGYLLPWILWLGSISVVCHMMIEPSFSSKLESNFQSYLGQKMFTQLPGEQFHKIMGTDQQIVIYFNRHKDKIRDIFAWVQSEQADDAWQVINASQLEMDGRSVHLTDGERWLYDSKKDFAWSHFQFQDYLLERSLFKQNSILDQYKGTLLLWQERFTSRSSAVILNERLMLPLMFVVLTIIPFVLVRPSTKPIRYLIYFESLIFFLFYICALILTHGYIKKRGWDTLVFVSPHIITLFIAGCWWVVFKSQRLFGVRG